MSKRFSITGFSAWLLKQTKSRSWLIQCLANDYARDVGEHRRRPCDKAMPTGSDIAEWRAYLRQTDADEALEKAWRAWKRGKKGQ
jgi:hypothetical protein